MADVDTDMMSITPLGGGQEVGRSCILLKFKGRTVLLDCGVHSGKDGIDGMPFFDSIDAAEVDIVLITHFHLDHCASLPYFTEKTNFEGRIFMTHATKAVMRLLLADNIRLQQKPLYSEQDLQRCVDRCEVVDFHQTFEVKGIKFTASAAGHVLGAAMFTIEIGGIKTLYTGDYSMEEDRHLACAEIPSWGSPDVLIVESTFGVQTLACKEERERRFTGTVDDIVSRGGNCLIPVFALGRAQELLLILEEYWLNNPELQGIPVFYASKMATKALRVYQTFVNMMNKAIRDITDVANPFKFDHIKALLNDGSQGAPGSQLGGPSVVMASPGFLQNGVSRQLFERWCDDEKNGVIIAGYTVEGTLAHSLLSSPNEITCLDNRTKARRCSIEHISFSAHVDYAQNLHFIRSVLPDNIILVHGEKKQTQRLCEALGKEVDKNWPSRDGHKPPIVAPANGKTVKINYQKLIDASIVGKASTELVEMLDGNKGTGAGATTSDLPAQTVLVTENFSYKVVAVDEMQNHSSCRLSRVTQRVHVPIPIGYLRAAGESCAAAVGGVKDEAPRSPILEAVHPYVEDVMDTVVWKSAMHGPDHGVAYPHPSTSIAADDRGSALFLLVRDLVVIREDKAANALVVEWNAAPTVDMVADCIVGTLYQALSVPAMLRNTSSAGFASITDSKGTDAAPKTKRGKTTVTGKAGKLNAETEEPVIPTEPLDCADGIVKKLKLGLVNPKNAINKQIVQEAVKASAVGATDGAGCQHHARSAGSKESQYVQRLKNMAGLLKERFVAAEGPFQSVRLNAPNTCLIVRGVEKQSEMTGATATDSVTLFESPEAYCFFVFNTTTDAAADDDTKLMSMHKHHAVVQSEDAAFQEVVVKAIGSLL